MSSAPGGKGRDAIFAALAAGATPELPGWERLVPDALRALVRAVASSQSQRELLERPLGDALVELARTLAANGDAEAASRELEVMLRESAKSAKLPLLLKHRLWSQVVELQQRLDVYDPGVGADGDDLNKLQRRLSQAGLPKVARDVAKRELRLLRSMQSNHHDYSTYFAHLDLMARLPWHAASVAPPDLDAVRVALDREHAGLERPKRRMLEHLAVHALGGSGASTVLCLAGPPGVGKTSLARAIARALDRPFVRVALGGIHDESEIRGHRISFTAAGPGRIVNGFARAGAATAVVLLDEIDKIGTDRSRSPDAALLEVLDPEQNAHFQDNYLGVPFDLSHALFLCTANDTSQINEVLRDRLEIVELEGYTAAEKTIIVRQHLLPALHVEHGLPQPLTFADEALATVIEAHTKEAGVRQLRRALAAIHRARALELVEHKRADVVLPVDPGEVRRVLGPPRFLRQLAQPTLPVGVAIGLSVGPDGGSLLYVEVATMKGRGKLRVTGRAGRILEESIEAALALVRMDPRRFGVDPERLHADLHVHLPEGAIAKDGPSAGVAIVAALVSALRGTAVRSDVAMTGEISLQGRVLPVGGMRAKIIAAERAGLRTVIVPADNAADVPEDVAISIVSRRRPSTRR